MKHQRNKSKDKNAGIQEWDDASIWKSANISIPSNWKKL